jgi:hypothetical protein
LRVTDKCGLHSETLPQKKKEKKKHKEEEMEEKKKTKNQNHNLIFTLGNQ